MTSFIDYRKQYPDLFKKPHVSRSVVKSLNQLKCKPQEAISAGYIKVSDEIKNGPLVLPSYWVSKDNWIEFQKELNQFKISTTVSKKSKIKSFLVEYFDKFGIDIPVEDVEQYLGNENFLDLQAETATDYIQKAYQSKLNERLTSFFLSKKTYLEVDGWKLEADTPNIFIWLFNNSIEEKIAELLALKEKEIEQLFLKWNESRPAWFSVKALKSWVGSHLKTPQSTPKHPLMTHTMYGLLLKKNKYYFPQIEKNLVVSCHERICNIAWLYEDVEKLANDKNVVIAKAAQEELASLVEYLVNSESSEFLSTLNISAEKWKELIWFAIKKVCTNKFSPEDQKKLIELEIKSYIQTVSNEICAQKCKQELPANLRDYYPLAKSLNREIVFITGPTNSGKTYNAVQEMARSSSGAYLGPLRLLALEIRDTLIQGGVKTSLVTGEQVELEPGANHVASTIEMLNYAKPVDVVIIDEAQLIGDNQRGSAWLHAVLGAPAKKLFIIGSPESKNAILNLLSTTKEKIEIVEKQRLTNLKIQSKPTSFGAIPPQSAIIAFSRKEVLAIAQKLKDMGKKVSVVYGPLPAEVRRKQSELFSTGQTDLIVATDAVGMGLNLPIKGVYFTTGEKWNGKEIEPVDPHLVWQIAGRAGRFGHFEEGQVGALDAQTLAYVKQCMATRPDMVEEKYYCNLTFPIAEKISEHLDTKSLEHILRFYQKYMKLDDNIEAIVTEEQFELAKIVDKYSALSITEKLLLSNAPAVNGKYPDAYYERFVKHISENKEFPTQAYIRELEQHSMLQDLENRIKSLNLYAWMHYRFEHIFLHMDKIRKTINETNEEISKRLLSRKTK